MVPLFSLWFGDTMQGAILFIAFTAFVLVYPITVNAIGNVASHYEQYARSLGASSARVYVPLDAVADNERVHRAAGPRAGDRPVGRDHAAGAVIALALLAAHPTTSDDATPEVPALGSRVTATQPG
ncbi:MAG: hypothetical protein R2736_11260 [Solirubrobacterales bacterium]